jgi:diguanylate cyclase (GGDEF)-like protein/PAS domain S-box-containing protein
MLWAVICLPAVLRARQMLQGLGRAPETATSTPPATSAAPPPAPASTTPAPASTTPAPLPDPRSAPAIDTGRLQNLIDAMDAGIVLWDADDRLVLCNRDFRQLYASIAHALVPGQRFEDILRQVVAQGLVPQAAGQEEAWIAERLRQHAEPAATLIRQFAGSWRRIVEQRLGDGSRLAYSVDVTELVDQGAALTQARQAAQAAAQRLEDAIEALPDGFALFDADDRLSMCNTRYRAMYASSAPALRPGARFEEILRYGLERGQYPGAGGNEAAWLAERLDRHRRPRGALLQELPGNRWLRVDERLTRDGCVAGVRSDVSELVQREQQLEALNCDLAASRAELQAVINTAHSAIVTFDPDGTVRSANAATHSILGWSEAELVGQPVSRIGALPLQAVPGLDLRIDHRDGRELMLHVAVSDFSHGERRRFVALLTDITDREVYAQALRASNLQLAELSQTDGLTGLANRRLFDQRLQEEWQRAARHGVPLALLMIDVDHFKRYNDHHGHLCGDDCLRAVAQALLGCARRASDLVARYGGEEFAVLMPHASVDEAKAQAQRCLDTLTALALRHGDSPVGPLVTLSIGIGHLQPVVDDGVGPKDLLQQADRALYSAKHCGRDRVVLDH